jgi:hypothetical protein
VFSSSPRSARSVSSVRVGGIGFVAEQRVLLEAELVRVPALVADRAGTDHLDEADALLYQAAGEQAALAELGAAVGVAHRVGLIGQVEHADARAEYQPRRATVDVLLLGHRFAAARLGEFGIEPFGQGQSALDDAGRHGRGNVRRQGAGRVDLERVVAHAQHTSVDVAGGDPRAADADERGQVGFELLAIAGDDGAPSWITDGRRHVITGPDQRDGAFVILFVADHRTDERDLVEFFGSVGPALGHLHAGEHRVDGVRGALIL